MKRLWQEVSDIFNQKVYTICVLITAILSYGFAICQPMVGIDDSAIGRYFSEGIGPIMGRFGYYLLNKVCPVAEYTPFVTDFIGVALLVLGSTLWCVVWQRAMNRSLSKVASTAFSCVMISSPIISEVFIYYLHNGIAINYCLSAILMLIFMEAVQSVNKKQKVGKMAVCLLLLWICNSFVESFTIVFLMAIVMVWILQAIYGEQTLTWKDLSLQSLWAGLILVLSVLVRSITIELVTWVFSLQDKIGIMNRRSVFEALDWFQSGDGLAEFVMTIKKYIAMYYVNAIAYVPIRIYVIAVILLFVYALYRLFARKQVLPLIGVVAMQCIPLILIVLEGHATFYRNSQFLPIYAAFVVLLLTCALEACAVNVVRAKKLIAVWCVLIGILVYNQAYEMTQWFYVDYMKYEDAKNTVVQISNELEHSYDTEKPIVFVGNYTIPKSIVQKMYVDYETAQYEKIARILDVMDPNLKACFAMPYGYSLSSEAVYSVFTWGNRAFEGWDKETHDFFAMHGHRFERISKPETVTQIQAEYTNLPGWPMEGSIIETETYIVVHFG